MVLRQPSPESRLDFIKTAGLTSSTSSKSLSSDEKRLLAMSSLRRLSSLRMQGSPESRLKYPEISARLQRVYFTLSFYTNSSPQLILHYSALQFFRDVRSGSVCCWQGYILVFEILIPIFRFEIEERSAKPLQLFQS